MEKNDGLGGRGGAHGKAYGMSGSTDLHLRGVGAFDVKKKFGCRLSFRPFGRMTVLIQPFV